MIFKYNSMNMLDYPIITYCSQSRKGKGILNVSKLTMSLMFCETSEMSFEVYSNNPYYDKVVKDRVLKVDNFGYWVISEVSEDDNGQYGTKSVKAYSYDVILSKKNVTLESDLYQLYDVINPNNTLLGLIENNTNWKIGHVDSTLLNMRRTMEFENTAIYTALMTNISDAFECYFLFDTDNMLINCYSRFNKPERTCINLSFRNLIKEMKVNDNQDGIITALTVTGGDDVGISLVNPIGTNIIYDFSYYYDDMSENLKNSIIEWKNKIENNTEQYASKVNERRNLNIRIVTEEGILSQKKTKLKASMDAQSIAITNNNTERLAELKPQIESEQEEVKIQEQLIEQLNNDYQTVCSEIANIIKSLSFKSNFTDEQITELEYYIISGSYENENFIFTSIMEEHEKIDMEYQLYEQALKEFEKLSHPLYEFDVNIINFINNPAYKPFINDLELGKTVNLEYKEDIWVNPRIIKINLDWDSPENSNIVLSDLLRSIDSLYTFADKFTATAKASNKVAISANKWDEPVKNGFYGKVNDYIDSAFDLANKEILDAKDQVVAIGSYGIRGRKTNETGYDDEQVAIINNLIAFTDDGWNSTKTALGKININGNEYYGLSAEAIMGRFIAGDQLIISNEDNTFSVDGSGATLFNADFTIEKDNTKIVISPDEGFSIKKKNGSIWDDVLTEDIDGNIVANSIKLATGDIGGWTIERDRLSSPVGDYIASDGTGKLSLLRWNNSAAWFDGNIYANNLSWRYGDGDYKSIFSSNGYMSGGWLGNGSVGVDKRLVDEWDELYANKIVVDELIAKSITVDNLTAGFIEAEGIKTELMFGGKFYVCDTDNINNNAQIYGYKDNISSEIQNVYCMAIRSTGNISLEPGYGDVLIKDKRLYAGSVTTNVLTVNGESNFNNDISINDKYIKGRVGFKDGDVWFENGFSTYNGDVNFYSKVRFSGEVVVHQNDRDYAGASATIYDKDGLKVEVRNGIITHIGH